MKKKNSRVIKNELECSRLLRKGRVPFLIIFLLTSFSFPFSLAKAESSPYNYNGSCATQSNWTQQALAITTELEGFIGRLMADPNCNQHREVFLKADEDMKAIAAHLKSISTEKDAGKKTTLSQEIGALSTYTMTGGIQNSVAKLLLGKLFRRSEIAAEKGVSATNGMSSQEKFETELSNLKKRTKEAFHQGLALLNTNLENIPSMRQCLVKSPSSGHFFASILKFIGAFAASGEDDGGVSISNTISNFVKYTRDSVFAESLRRLKGSELSASLSCILEVTTENYCKIRDSNIIFKKMIASGHIDRNGSGELRLFSSQNGEIVSDGSDIEAKRRAIEKRRKAVYGESPLRGYYILTKNISLLTDWLQVVQIGVDPRTPTDADQKNKPLNEINTFLTSLNDIRGMLNKEKTTILGAQSIAEKRTLVLALIKNMSNVMDGDSYRSSSQMNFYTTTFRPMHIPFKLLGIDTPDEVLGTSDRSTQMQRPGDYLDANFEKMPVFTDPELLVERVSNNLEDMIQRANSTALNYFLQWYVIDKTAIAMKALIGTHYNAKESFEELDFYLKSLENRISTKMGDKSMLVGIRDTRTRIKKVLGKFKNLEELGEITLTMSDEEQTIRSAKVSAELIEEVFEQFEILKAKSGWLKNRVIDFVEYDFNIMQRSNIDMTPYIEEIYTATNRDFINQVLTMTEANPAAQALDFSTGLVTAKNNILAIEDALSETYLDQIVQLKQSTYGEPWVYFGQEYNDKYPHYNEFNNDEIPGTMTSQFARNFRGFKDAYGRGILTIFEKAIDWGGFFLTHGTYYKSVAVDDEFGSMQKQMNKFCVQVLAFNQLHPFWMICKNARLYSPFETGQGDEEQIDPKLIAQVADELEVGFEEKALEKRVTGDLAVDEKNGNNNALNHSLRICGMRDYIRKNLVVWLLHGETRHE